MFIFEFGVCLFLSVIGSFYVFESLVLELGWGF